MSKYFTRGNQKSLETFLLNVGLSLEDIAKLKTEKNLGSFNMASIYGNAQKKSPRLVPVEKIVGIGSARGTAGESWFENLLNYNLHNFRETSIDELCLNMSLALESFRDSFKDPNFSNDNLSYTYYKDDDIYVSNSGGSHRTLFSKISGAEFIIAEVYEDQVDPVKEKNFSLLNSKKIELEDLIRQMNLHEYNDNSTFLNKDTMLGYDGKGVILKKEVKIYDFSKTSDVMNAIDQIDDELDHLYAIHMEYNKLRYLPPKLLKEAIKAKLAIAGSYWPLEHLNKLLQLGWRI